MSSNVLDASPESAHSLRDILLYDHQKLDTNCVAVWPKLWQALREQPVTLAAGRQDVDLVICKIVSNYSHVHQLHRLISKLLEAARSPVDELLPAEVICPPVLLRQLERCFLDTSEQQMSLIIGILLKEITQRLESIASGTFISLTKAVTELIWTGVRNLRVKPTTRQEVLQALCKQYFDMKDSVIIPVLRLADGLTNVDGKFCVAVLVHAWASFPLVFRDKYAVSMEEPLDAVQKCLSSIMPADQSNTGNQSINHYPELLYWKHKLLLLQFTMTGSTGACTSSSLFDWSVLQSLPDNFPWSGGFFEITRPTLPVALWDSICSNYPFVLESGTFAEHLPFARLLVDRLTKTSSQLSDGKSLSLRSVSDAFLETNNISNLPTLHAAVVQVLELSLKDCLERTGTMSLPRLKKRSKQAERTLQIAEELLNLLRLLNQVGFIVESGVVKFSLSLIWKSFEFLLETADAWTDVHSLTAAEVCFANLILSVPSRDPKYWRNILSDFCSVREKMNQLTKCSGKMLTILDSQTFRIILTIADSGSVDNLNLVFLTAKEKFGYLIPLILDALMVRLQQPGVVKLSHEVIGSMCENYIAMMVLSEKDQATLINCAAVSKCIQKASETLKKIGSKSFAQSIASLKKFLTYDSVYGLLERAIASGKPTELEMALSNLALYTEVRRSCKIKVVQQVLSLFRSKQTVEFETGKENAAVSSSANLDHLDDAALYGLLVSLTQNQSNPRITSPPQQLNLSPVTSVLAVLFSQFGKYCKPGKLAKALTESLKSIRIATSSGNIPIEYSMLLCKLVVSLKVMPALSRAFVPVDELVLNCLNLALTSTKDVAIMCDIMTLLQILLRSQRPLEVCRIALSRPVYACLLRSDLSDTEFTSLFEKCSVLLNDIMMQPHLVSPQTSPVIIEATSIWLISILERARQSPASLNTLSSRKAVMVRNSSFVERLLGNFSKHNRAFSKVVIHLIGVYCHALQNGALYPEAKEHIVAGLYRLLDGIDPHSRSMGSVTMGVESREIYKALVEDHQKFHKYRGLV